MDLPFELITYYRDVVEPMRRTFLQSQVDGVAALDSSMESAIDNAVFPRERRPERPILTYVGWLLAGGSPESTVPAQAAIAGEFMHSAGLIYDDVVDSSAIRNFHATVWAAYSKKYAGEPWAANFGQSVAIWLANLLTMWAYDMFIDALSEVSGETARRAKKVWTDAATGIAVSQYKDLTMAANGARTAAERIQAAKAIAALKGRYVAALPLELGAALAGAPTSLSHELREFGQPLGEAYVYRNDLEGVFGDETEIDKPANDLRERRLTLLLALAEERASSEQADLLRKAGDSQLTDQEVQAIKAVVVATGARARIEALSQQLAHQAATVIDQGTLPARVRLTLTQFLEKSMSIHKLN